MSTNHIKISHLGKEVLKQITRNACLVSHQVPKDDFTTSELRAINWCRVSKGIFFMINICNHQGTHLQKSATYNVTTFSMIHKSNCKGKHHTTIASWRTWKKVMITLCDKNKYNLRPPLGKLIFYDNKFITSCQWFLFRDIHTLYDREHGT